MREIRRAAATETEIFTVTVRAYGALNDFLPPPQRHVSSTHTLGGRRSAKDLVESLGVPHPEVDLLLINGDPVPFDQIVMPGDRLAVFPRFSTIPIETITRVRPQQPAATRFVADVHLGTLARLMRLAGLDTAYRPDADDEHLIATAAGEGRILLTRDVDLLKRRSLTHGYFVRHTRPRRQLVEVLAHFGPLTLHPWSRCPRCNGALRHADKAEIESALPPRTRAVFDEFTRCEECGQVYWQGSHWARLRETMYAAVRATNRGHDDV